MVLSREGPIESCSVTWSDKIFICESYIKTKTDCMKQWYLIVVVVELISRVWLFRKKEKKVKSLSHVRFFAVPRTVTYQAPPSMEFSRQEYWNGLPFPSPGDLPNPGIEPGSPTLQADILPSEPPGKPYLYTKCIYSLILTPLPRCKVCGSAVKEKSLILVN